MYHIPITYHKSFQALDFGGYANATELGDADWTEIGALGSPLSDGTWTVGLYPAGISGRGVRANQGGFNEYRGIYWNQPGTAVTDFEILALLDFVDLPNNVGGSGLTRISILGGPDGYDCTLINPGAVVQHMGQYSDGVFDSQIGASMFFSFSQGQKFWMRWRIAGTILKHKVWNFGDVEPGFTDPVSDPTYTTGGLGFAIVETTKYNIYWFSVATGTNKTAPFPSG
jgi:hypothetical protein